MQKLIEFCDSNIGTILCTKNIKTFIFNTDNEHVPRVIALINDYTKENYLLYLSSLNYINNCEYWNGVIIENNILKKLENKKITINRIMKNKNTNKILLKLNNMSDYATIENIEKFTDIKMFNKIIKLKN